ncbi:DUF6463 family protein [Nocardia carnea]|uniref:DUF6463 family protein n=1 Tax=Nocardia carnea TaxID=37328 RepID=UPI002454A278|nr:DUF6463 family protein [Nocardia carnea]
MNSKTIPWTGLLVTAIGAIHTALGAVQWATSDEPMELSFWFTGFGVVAVAYGLALIDAERIRGRLSWMALAPLIAIAGFGLAVYPLSGFTTLVVPIATGLASRLRRSAAGPAVPIA